MDIMWTDFDEYLKEVHIRNGLKWDGENITFEYPEEYLVKKKDFFREMWKSHISVYKALTFIEDYDESNEEE